MAKRITEVGQRQEFLGGCFGKSSKHGSARNIKSQYASGRNRSKSPSYIELPGIDHQVGTLNGDKRKKEWQQITRYNLIMAKKLIDTRSVISYDDQQRHNHYVSYKPFILFLILLIFFIAIQTQKHDIKRPIEDGEVQHARKVKLHILGKERNVICLKISG